MPKVYMCTNCKKTSKSISVDDDESLYNWITVKVSIDMLFDPEYTGEVIPGMTYSTYDSSTPQKDKLHYCSMDCLLAGIFTSIEYLAYRLQEEVESTTSKYQDGKAQAAG